MKVPKWMRELECFFEIKDTLIFEGNIYDEYPVIIDVSQDPGPAEPAGFKNLNEYITAFVHSRGYRICFYDFVNGFLGLNKDILDIFRDFMENMKEEASYTGEKSADDRTDTLHQMIAGYEELQEAERNKEKGEAFESDRGLECPLEMAPEVIKLLITKNETPTVVCMNFASRVLADPARMSEKERLFFSQLLYAGLKARKTRCEDKVIRQNHLFMIADKINDIPTWFYLDNPNVKDIHIAIPDRHVREMYVDFYREFFASDEADEKELDHFIEITEDMKVLDLRGIRELKRNPDMRASKIADIVALYKYGIKENPWDGIERERLEHAEEKIKERVK